MYALRNSLGICFSCYIHVTLNKLCNNTLFLHVLSSVIPSLSLLCVRARCTMYTYTAFNVRLKKFKYRIFKFEKQTVRNKYNNY